MAVHTKGQTGYDTSLSLSSKVLISVLLRHLSRSVSSFFFFIISRRSYFLSNVISMQSLILVISLVIFLVPRIPQFITISFLLSFHYIFSSQSFLSPFSHLASFQSSLPILLSCFPSSLLNPTNLFRFAHFSLFFSIIFHLCVTFP